jgi:hypothetical protein
MRRLRRPTLLAAALLAAAGAGLAGGYALFDDGDSAELPAVAPTVILEQSPEPEAAEEIGFPAFATRNTTRVGGADPIADAAGIALASYPAQGGVEGPRLAVLAPADSWQAALAAGSLAAAPIEAPILLGEADEIPGLTAEALSELDPRGVRRADGVQVLAIGDVAAPERLETETIEGSDPARLARLVDRHRQRYGGTDEPAHILVVSSTQSEYAMPAAAWAARSGDPIVFADDEDVPEPTLEVIESYPDASIYVLGPESVIGERALRRLERRSGRVQRIGADDPVRNAIEFARFVDGGFGWDINDPGHGFVIANLDRPADAGAAAPLSAGGKPGPLLLTDSADQVPQALRSFLLDTKPGFTDDPTRAVYNHLWLLGDTSAISVGFQAQVDELTRLQRVERGSGVPDFLQPDELEAEEPDARRR